MAIEPAASRSAIPAPAESTGGLTWQTQAYLIGALSGLLLGVLAALLYVRASQESARTSAPPRIKTGDAMKLTLALLTLIRQIAELGGK